MLYNDEQRTILKSASAALDRAGMMHNKASGPAIDALRKATYQGKKDFPAIEKLTNDLEKSEG
jgi:hypothetical protein